MIECDKRQSISIMIPILSAKYNDPVKAVH